MKTQKINKSKYIWSILLVIILLPSCYTDTVEDLSQFTFQLPVFFYERSVNRQCPSASWDFTNLNKYSEYRSNKKRIEKAEMFQFAYWLDTLVLPITQKPFNPKTDNIIFDKVTYSIRFAKPKGPGLETSLNPNDFVVDNAYEPYLIGEFLNVNASEYYRSPRHIVSFPEERAKVISKVLKNTPYFFIVSEYTKYQNQPADTVKFPYLEARCDLVIRFQIKL
jgi:hypothetical protein